jgi:hypothetical protein
MRVLGPEAFLFFNPYIFCHINIGQILVWILPLGFPAPDSHSTNRVVPDTVMERIASFTRPNGVGVHQTIVTLKERRKNLIQTFFQFSRPLNSDPLKIQQGKRTCYWSADRNDASC